MNKAKFIVIEGQGFTGKTTQAKLLIQKLEDSGIQALETREPGGVPAAEKLREDILELKENEKLTPEEEVKLFYAARKIFLEELVRPSLEKGTWIVTTRFSPSTFVYQGIVGGYDMDLLKNLDEEVVGNTKPDLIILLDLPPEEVLKRMVEDTRKLHSYNEFDEALMLQRREGYLKLADQDQKTWSVVDASGSEEEISQKIWDIVKSKFEI